MADTNPFGQQVEENPFGKDLPPAGENPFGKDLPSYENPFGREVVPEDIDPILYNSMRESGATHEDAVARARGVATNLANSAPQTPKRDLSEYEDASSILGTAVEGAIDGLTFGAGTLVEGAIGDAFDIEGMRSRDIEAREEANPATSLTANLGAGLLTGGASIVENLAAKGLSKWATKGLVKRGTAAAVRGLAKADVAGRVATRATNLAGRGVLKLAGAEAPKLADIATDVERIREKVARGELVTKAEQEILDVFKRSQKPAVADYLTPRTKSAAKVAESRALRERETFVIERKLADTYDKLGWGKRALQFSAQLATSAGMGAGIGAGQGLIQTGKQELSDVDKRRQFQELGMSPEASAQAVDALGEDFGTRLMNNVREGATLGAELGGGIPVLFKSISYAAKATREARQVFMNWYLPKAGSTFLSGAEKEIIEGSLGIGTSAARQGSITRGEKGLTRSEVEDNLVRSLQYQYENAAAYFNHLEELAGEYGVASLDLPVDESNILGALQAIRKNWMVEKDGKWVYDKNKVITALKNDPLRKVKNPNAPGGFEIVLNLPKEMDAIDRGLELVEARASAQINMASRAAGTPIAGGEFVSGDPRFIETGLAKGAIQFPPGAKSQFPLEQAIGPAGREELFPMRNLSISRGGLPGPSILEDQPIGDLIEGYYNKKMMETTAPYDLSKFAAYGTAIGTVAHAAGLGLPTAVIGGAAGSALINSTIDSVVNPLGLAKNFSFFQKRLNNIERGASDFANYMVGGPRLGTTAAPATSKTGEALGVTTEPSRPTVLTSAEAKALYDADAELIAKLSGPEGIPNFDKTFGGDLDLLDATYPKLAGIAGGVIPRQVAFLQRKMKELTPDPASPGVLSGLKQREPTKAQLFQYGLYSQYTRNPDQIYTDIAEKGYVPTQALEVLQEVYPARYALLQKKILDAVLAKVEAKEQIDAKQLAIIDKLMPQQNGKLSGFSADQIKALQASMAPAQAGVGGPTSGAESKAVLLQTEGTSLAK